MKAKAEEGHERNINDMAQVDEYNLLGKNKDASTINDSAYYELDEHKVEIRDSSKQVEASKKLITYTQVCKNQLKPLLLIHTSLELESLDEGDVASPKELLFV